MTSLLVTLAWPARPLSPNARAHWAVKARAARAARRDAECATRVALEHEPHATSPTSLTSPMPLTLHFTLWPPSRRRFDQDNVLAALKSALDGIADALGMDDSEFKIGRVIRDEPCKAGRVEILVTSLSTTQEFSHAPD